MENQETVLKAEDDNSVAPNRTGGVAPMGLEVSLFAFTAAAVTQGKGFRGTGIALQQLGV